MAAMDTEVGFSGDELILLMVCGAISLHGLWQWAVGLRPISKLGAPSYHRLPLYAAVALGFAALWRVIWHWADTDIPAFGGYVALVLAMGGAWLTLGVRVFPWLGVSLRDDALEQRNAAAVWALSGGMLAILLTFAGSNIGEGPSFWNNVFTGVLATSALLACWLALASAGGLAHAVTQERDCGAGLRLGVALVSIGIVFARAAAGDWHSMSATLIDFGRDGWFGFALTAAAVGAERWLVRPLDLRLGGLASEPSLALRGALPAAVYLAAAIHWVGRIGWWEGAPR
jgi:uncharacterized membrane protein YjfL (UPF0719 family)